MAGLRSPAFRACEACLLRLQRSVLVNRLHGGRVCCGLYRGLQVYEQEGAGAPCRRVLQANAMSVGAMWLLCCPTLDSYAIVVCLKVMRGIQFP